MSLPVVLTPEAEAEFDAAADWYEQRAGLGSEFTANVRDVLHRIAGRRGAEGGVMEPDSQ